MCWLKKKQQRKKSQFCNDIISAQDVDSNSFFEGKKSDIIYAYAEGKENKNIYARAEGYCTNKKGENID